jgi:hypothetical protein
MPMNKICKREIRGKNQKQNHNKKSLVRWLPKLGKEDLVDEKSEAI